MTKHVPIRLEGDPRTGPIDSGIPNEMDQLYAINDALTELAHRFQVAFDSQDEEDEVLNDLTHEIGRRFRIGPYRIKENTNAR